MAKIKTQKEIIRIVKNLKRKTKGVVTRNGSFDLLHPGHIQSLQEAKKQGDVLIVLLNSDQSVRTYKGPGHPILLQKERVEMLSALECVDFVVIFNEITPTKILSQIKPDIHCVSPEWGRERPENKAVEKNGGKIHVLKWTKGFSSTALVSRILASQSKSKVRAVFLDRGKTIDTDEPAYLHKIKDFKFAPGVIPALKKLSKSDYKIIVATNQSGVGRGYFSEKDVQKLHQWLKEDLKKKGVRIDEIYYCPHKPEDNCPCRKPKPGLLVKAAKDFGINLSKSWFVGDREVDVLCGKEGNLKTIMIKNRSFQETGLQPDFYVKNLLAAVKIILSQ